MQRPDTTSAARSKECEMGRAEVLGTISARAPRRSAESMVWRLRGCCPFGLGGFVTSLCSNLPQRPIHRKKETPQETVAHALTAPHPVQPYCDTVARSRNRTWRFID